MNGAGPLRLWVLLLIVGASWAGLRRTVIQRTLQQGAPVPVAEAEEWMVRTLPGIGPITAPAMLAAIRAGRLDALPAGARPHARERFAGWIKEPRSTGDD